MNMKPLIRWIYFRQENFRTPGFVALLVVLLIGCTLHPVVTNAKTPQLAGQNVPGKFVWYDLFTHDLESSSRFYEELFGWSFVNYSSGNTKVKQIFSGENHIGNAIEIEPPTKNVSESQWLPYMSVANVDDSVKLIEDEQGIILIPARKLLQGGRAAVCLDSQKAVFAIIENSKYESVSEQAVVNRWIGSELWTDDLDGTEKFYGNLADYTLRTINMKNGERYQTFIGNGQITAGVVKIPFNDVQPNWVPYIAVEDAMAVAEKVLQLGGQFLTEPDRDLPENAAVIIADPSGAVFGIQQVMLVDSDEGGEK